MTESTAQTGSPRLDADALPWIPGATAGGLAALLGYLVAYLWQGDRLEGAFAGVNVVLDLLGSAVPTWKAVGWLYFGAHNVAVTVPLPGGATASRNLVAGGAPDLLYLLPPVVLVLAGFVVARYATARDPASGALAGAAILPGYLAVVLAALVLTGVTVGEATVGPDPVTGALLAGLVYPAAFGAVGGALGAITG